MRKHTYSPFVLVCTLSTPCEGIERTLPGQGIEPLRIKKLPGRS
jgi:hypothetical protein